MAEKRIETVELPVSELKTGFGNPRKIKKKKKEELQESLNTFGDFGLILIDEENNIIAELRAINIKDNVHSGEWDMDVLADWTADLNIDLGVDLDNKSPEERKLKDMELIHYEKYDYVLIVCRYETDYNDLCRKLGIENAKVPITNKRKIKARAVWYDQMKAQIVYKDDIKHEGEE